MPKRSERTRKVRHIHAGHMHCRDVRTPVILVTAFFFAIFALVAVRLADVLSQWFINSQLPEALGIRTWVSAYFITVGYMFIAAGLVVALVLAVLGGRRVARRR
jgi:multisubunit Na+/H+ antiporter MnhB subunit